MNCMFSGLATVAIVSAAFFIQTAPADAGDLTASELAKIAENPFANLISVPFQYNAYVDSGPGKATVSVLNIEPIVPFSLNNDWNIITRTIVPVVWQPSLYQGGVSANWLGDTQFSAFLVPNNTGKWIWGVGSITQAPSHTNDQLGNNRWGLGPTAAAVHIDKQSPWVYGALINNVWSVGSSKGDPTYNHGFLEPVVAYNFPGGTYLFSTPEINVDWRAAGGQKWTVPLGGGVGQIVQLGKLPVNLSSTGFYNVVRPEFGPRWQIQVEVQFLFPKL